MKNQTFSSTDISKTESRNIHFKGNPLILLSFFFALIAVGCQKDNTVNPATIGSTASQYSSSITFRGDITMPSVNNGMLWFSSFSELRAFTDWLESEEQDVTKVRNTYTQLGYDVNSEDAVISTDHPVSKVVETQLGHNSARSKEENTIAQLFAQGEYDHAIVVNPHWKTVLNEWNSVRVGKRIYKYFDNGGIAIILNSDWALYENIKNLSYEAIQPAHNLILTSDAQDGWENYFNFESDGVTVLSEKAVFIPRFNTSLTTDGKYKIKNISLIESTTNAEVTYNWTYSDNTTSTGVNPVKDISPNEGLTLVVNNGAGNTTITEASMLLCDVNDFAITSFYNYLVRFELEAGYNSAIYDLKWVFSDGTSVMNTNPYYKTTPPLGLVTCQMIRKSTGLIECQKLKAYLPKCGDKLSVSKNWTYDNAAGTGKKWKMWASITVTSTEIKTFVKVRKWNNFLNTWVVAWTDGVCNTLEGEFKKETTVSGTKTCTDTQINISACLEAGIFPNEISGTVGGGGNKFVEPGDLYSKPKFKLNGTWLIPPLPGGKLYLE